MISTIIDKLKGAKYFTKLDIRLGYNNICIRDRDQWKEAFKMPFGLQTHSYVLWNDKLPSHISACDRYDFHRNN
jgi:hypothetical protein